MLRFIARRGGAHVRGAFCNRHRDVVFNAVPAGFSVQRLEALSRVPGASRSQVRARRSASRSVREVHDQPGAGRFGRLLLLQQSAGTRYYSQPASGLRFSGHPGGATWDVLGHYSRCCGRHASQHFLGFSHGCDLGAGYRGAKLRARSFAAVLGRGQAGMATGSVIRELAAFRASYAGLGGFCGRHGRPVHPLRDAGSLRTRLHNARPGKRSQPVCSGSKARAAQRGYTVDNGSSTTRHLPRNRDHRYRANLRGSGDRGDVHNLYSRLPTTR